VSRLPFQSPACLDDVRKWLHETTAHFHIPNLEAVNDAGVVEVA